MISPHPSPRSWLGRPSRLFLIAALVAIFLAVVEEGWHAVASRRSEPGLGACWIWIDDVPVEGAEPRSFFAVRDLQIAEPPRQAWMSIVADEVYVLYINGQQVGANVYRPPATADLYRVETLLRPGTNRFVVEARSLRGAGGVLASLRFDEPHHVVLETDGSWRILPRFEPAILAPEQTLSQGLPPKIWGRPPTGRWRVAAPPGERPALPLVAQDIPTWGMRGPSPKGRWADLNKPRRRFPGLGRALIFDWRQEVAGYLRLQIEPSSSPEMGLLYCSSQWPDPVHHAADAVVLPIADSPFWDDTEVRRFRYCMTVGVPVAVRPTVAAVEPGLVHRLEARPADRLGVFGLVPPAKVSLESRVWHRVKINPRRIKESPEADD